MRWPAPLIGTRTRVRRLCCSAPNSEASRASDMFFLQPHVQTKLTTRQKRRLLVAAAGRPISLKTPQAGIIFTS